MKILLLEDVDKLGRAGTIVEVKDGYARNYLIPTGKAIRVTPGTIKEVETRQKLIERKRNKARLRAENLKRKLESITLKVRVKVGPEDKLYGSVTPAMIVQELEKLGISLDKSSVLLERPIKELGEKVIQVKLFEDIKAELKVEILPDRE